MRYFSSDLQKTNSAIARLKVFGKRPTYRQCLKMVRKLLDVEGKRVSYWTPNEQWQYKCARKWLLATFSDIEASEAAGGTWLGQSFLTSPAYVLSSLNDGKTLLFIVDVNQQAAKPDPLLSSEEVKGLVDHSAEPLGLTLPYDTEEWELVATTSVKTDAEVPEIIGEEASRIESGDVRESDHACFGGGWYIAGCDSCDELNAMNFDINRGWK